MMGFGAYTGHSINWYGYGVKPPGLFNFNAIFEFLEQFAVRCIVIFQQDVYNFEYKTYLVLIGGKARQIPIVQRL